jgi:hypothetical protein
MNILLWVLQIALAWFSIAGGVFQILKIEQLQKTVASMRALPRGLWACLGAFGCVAGVGLIVPDAIKVFTVVTPICAVGIAVESALISSFYIYYRDRSPLVYSAVMTVLAAFVAYGRLVLAPL